MIIAHHSTAAAITPHAADRSWVAFLQAALPPGVTSPIRIVGWKGAEIGRELHRVAELNAYEVQLIGLIPSLDPEMHARAIGEQHAAGHLHDAWYTPSGDLIAFIQHHAKRGLQELLSLVHPGAISEHVVDLRALAQLLGCAEVTVHRMITRGQIPFMKVGRNYRFQPKDVLAALQQQGILKPGRSAS